MTKNTTSEVLRGLRQEHLRWAELHTAMRCETAAQADRAKVEALDAALAALSAQPCTCPSGDGSLRWPCPQHPPPCAAPEAQTEPVAWMFEQDDGWGDFERRLSYSREAGQGESCRNLRPLYLAPPPSAVPEGWRLVPVEPVTGARYANGEWSRRNWEAALEDQLAAAPGPKEGV